MVRINAVDTGFFEDDLGLLERAKPDGVVLPKATPAAVGELGRRGPPVLAIVETALGLQLSGDTARAGRVAALALGAVDLGCELGLQPRRDGLEILFARSKLVMDSAAAEIRSPLDVVHLDIRDTAGLEQSARLARSLGFGGKLCIHPCQVPVINRVFTPSQDEVRWAERVISGYERVQQDGEGVLALDGQMVDLPVVQQARSILARAGRRSG
jgi:citrate lyase subunit beta/citryl-CoA lyase